MESVRYALTSKAFGLSVGGACFGSKQLFEQIAVQPGYLGRPPISRATSRELFDQLKFFNAFASSLKCFLFGFVMNRREVRA
jgi:hypothetical protein